MIEYRAVKNVQPLWEPHAADLACAFAYKPLLVCPFFQDANDFYTCKPYCRTAAVLDNLVVAAFFWWRMWWCMDNTLVLCSGYFSPRTVQSIFNNRCRLYCSAAKGDAHTILVGVFVKTTTHPECIKCLESWLAVLRKVWSLMPDVLLISIFLDGPFNSSVMAIAKLAGSGLAMWESCQQVVMPRRAMIWMKGGNHMLPMLQDCKCEIAGQLDLVHLKTNSFSILPKNGKSLRPMHHRPDPPRHMLASWNLSNTYTFFQILFGFGCCMEIIPCVFSTNFLLAVLVWGAVADAADSLLQKADSCSIADTCSTADTDTCCIADVADAGDTHLLPQSHDRQLLRHSG